jgi:hypothetical protein
MASTGGALPEAGGDHTEKIDPDDLDGLVIAVEHHLIDADHHRDLVTAARGFEMPRWEATARAVGTALADLAATPPPLPGRPAPRRDRRPRGGDTEPGTEGTQGTEGKDS